MLSTIRPYQAEAVEKMLELYKHATFGVGCESPTGTGKSIMMAMLAHRLASQGKRVLILAHRKELVEGNAGAVELVTGERCGIELNTKYCTHEGDWRELKANGGIVSASVDTLQGKRLRRQPQDLYDVIICDEAHHVRPMTKKQLGEDCPECEGTGKQDGVECDSCEGKGKQYQTGSKYIKVRTHFGSKVWFGFSGTFYRAGSDYDKTNVMTKVFDQVYQTGTLFDFIDKGWLVDMRIMHLAAVAVHLDFSKLKKKGIITDKQAQEVWETHKLEALSALRHGIAENVGDRTTLIFSPKVEHAKWVVEFIQQADTTVYPNMGPETADYVASYDLADDGRRLPYHESRRDSVIDRLKNKQLQYCANQGVFTEGTDIPTVAALVLARLVQSNNLIRQMIGRGARTLKGVLDGLENATAEQRKAAIAASQKPDCLVLDFAGAMTEGAGRDIASPTKLIQGGWSEAQRKMAEQYWKVMWEKGKAPSLLEAKEEIEHAASDWMQGVRAMIQEAGEKVDWEVTEIDPRTDSRKAVATVHLEGPGGGATDAQVRFLITLQNQLNFQKFSHASAMALSKKEAANEINELKKLRDQLPAPRWAYKVLRDLGYRGTMPDSWGGAQKLIDEIKKGERSLTY